MVPEFGCALWRMVFEQLDLTTMTEMQEMVRRAILNWEPRIDVDSVTVTDRSGCRGSGAHQRRVHDSPHQHEKQPGLSLLRQRSDDRAAGALTTMPPRDLFTAVMNTAESQHDRWLAGPPSGLRPGRRSVARGTARLRHAAGPADQLLRSRRHPPGRLVRVLRARSDSRAGLDCDHRCRGPWSARWPSGSARSARNARSGESGSCSEGCSRRRWSCRSRSIAGFTRSTPAVMADVAPGAQPDRRRHPRSVAASSCSCSGHGTLARRCRARTIIRHSPSTGRSRPCRQTRWPLRGVKVSTAPCRTSSARGRRSPTRGAVGGRRACTDHRGSSRGGRPPPCSRRAVRGLCAPSRDRPGIVNDFAARRADFYLRRILRDGNRKAVPDSVYLAFEAAAGTKPAP